MQEECTVFPNRREVQEQGGREKYKIKASVKCARETRSKGGGGKMQEESGKGKTQEECTPYQE
jgi:hypothetical protein